MKNKDRSQEGESKLSNNRGVRKLPGHSKRLSRHITGYDSCRRPPRSSEQRRGLFSPDPRKTELLKRAEDLLDDLQIYERLQLLHLSIKRGLYGTAT